jgi:hypothetical protein
MADSINFDIIQGDSFVLDVIYKDAQGNIVNLSGHTAVFQVRDTPGGKFLCASATTGNGITITPLQGKINVQLGPVDTSRFTLPKAAYQLQVTSPSGLKETLLSGWFSVSKAVI